MDIDQFRYAPSGAVLTADHLIELKHKYSNDIWYVIGKVIEAWQKTNPQGYRSFIISHEQIKQTQKTYNIGTSSFSGVSKDKATGGILRYTLDIPEKIIYMLRALYSPQELPFDRDFYAKFGKKFPQFKIMERSK